MNILQLMGDLFIRSPIYALVIAIFFFVLFMEKRKRPIKIAALAWSAYFVNELAMKIFWEHSNIRVELLIIYPLLLWVSIIALASFIAAIYNRRIQV